MAPHSAFDAILRETMAEVVAAEAIDEADARQAHDEIEQLRLRAAHLITMREGGPWMTGAAMQFAKDLPAGASGHPTMDIRFPQPHRRGEASGEGVHRAEPGQGSQQRQGRRVPDNGKQVG